MKLVFTVSIADGQRDALSEKTRQVFGSSCVLLHNSNSNLVQVDVFSGDELTIERVMSAFSIFNKWCEHKGIIIL